MKTKMNIDEIEELITANLSQKDMCYLIRRIVYNIDFTCKGTEIDYPVSVAEAIKMLPQIDALKYIAECAQDCLIHAYEDQIKTLTNNNKED
jgi:hypothetical protein